MINFTPQATVMCVLNVTPDSFSDGGALSDFGDILRAAEHALSWGASILDVGGESTRPGALPVSENEELARVIPAIKLIRKTFPDAVMSIDTRKSRVADAALSLGASIVNDVSGLIYSGEDMLQVVSRHQAKLIIMHSQGSPETMQDNPSYPDGVLHSLDTFFRDKIALAEEHGIAKANLILDPGFGFGKTVEDNLKILSGLDQFQRFNIPVLAGLSRKSFLTLGSRDIRPQDRESLTASAVTVALRKGVQYLRLHDAEVQMPVIRLAESLFSFEQAGKQFCSLEEGILQKQS